MGIARWTCCSFMLTAMVGCGSSTLPDSTAADSNQSDDATAIQTANQTQSSNSDSDVNEREDSSAPTQTTAVNAATDDHPEPSPVTFTLCSEGLPTSGMWKCDPVFADVNKDGNMDLAAIPRLGDGPQVWFGDGAGAWTSASNGLMRTESKSCGGGLRLHDVNNDDELDLVVADHCAGVYIYLGDGAGNWNMVMEGMYPADILPPSGIVEKYRGAESIAVGDIDKDGNADLVVGASDDAGIRMYLGDGTGAGWSRRDGGLPEAGWATRVQLEDMNDDGWLDIIAAYSLGPRVFINEEGAAWKDGSLGMPSPMMGGIFWGIDVADFNEDGRKDIAVANWIDGPEVYLQGDDGMWTKSPDVFEEMMGGAQGLAVGDIDLDGHVDMVVAGRKNLEGGFIRGVFLLLGDGTGGGAWKFLEHSGLPVTGLAAMAGIGLADINNDGYLDVAAGSGLIVETVPNGPRRPALPVRLLMWCNDAKSQTAVAAPED